MQENPSFIKLLVGALTSCCSYKSGRQQRDSDDGHFMSATSTSTDKSLYTSAGSHGSMSSQLPHNEPVSGGVLHSFTMTELKKATRNFSPSLKIGQGGFGVVYKGTLNDGRVVAVKRAKKDAFNKKLFLEFKSEVATLSKVEHLNVVNMIGSLEQDNELILVSEFVSHGNLRQNLDGDFGSTMGLMTRLDIAIDVARGLTYLHSYADESFIHRDVKSSNILLTEGLRAKLADFGFSRLGPTDLNATHVSTQVKGTAGYLDPEYLHSSRLTQKSDVYSFGILMVEIISGRRPIESRKEVNERITSRWAFNMFLQGRVMDVLDPKLEKSPGMEMVVNDFLDLAFQCAAPTKEDRPTMREVAQSLWNIRRDHQSRMDQRSLSSSQGSMPRGKTKDIDLHKGAPDYLPNMEHKDYSKSSPSPRLAFLAS